MDRPIRSEVDDWSIGNARLFPPNTEIERRGSANTERNTWTMERDDLT
jgi:hypothetical protein